MNGIRIADIATHVDEEIQLEGWLFNKRSSKKLHFLQVRDGSGIVQAVLSKADSGEELFDLGAQLTQESAIRVLGHVRRDERSAIGYELHVTNLELVHQAIDYPITKKEHGDAFLMDHRHLWLRSSRQQVILRVRHTLIRAIRDFFDNRGFILLDAPIFTPNACEGTTTLFQTDYFGRQAYLTQSGQLYQEAGALAFGRSYCFGPTFRAEKSKTRRHLTEFWMVEPEVAFMDLEGDMQLAEDFLCEIVARVLNEHETELERVLERDLAGLRKVEKPFPRISYDEAIKVIAGIREEVDDPELKAALDLEWGSDFGSPHETELTKRYDRPLIVYNFPAAIKAFYMKRDRDDARLACLHSVPWIRNCLHESAKDFSLWREVGTTNIEQIRRSRDKATAEKPRRIM